MRKFKFCVSPLIKRYLELLLLSRFHLRGLVIPMKAALMSDLYLQYGGPTDLNEHVKQADCLLRI